MPHYKIITNDAEADAAVEAARLEVDGPWLLFKLGTGETVAAFSAYHTTSVVQQS